MIKIDLPWSGQRELDAPDSSIALIKDQHRDSAYGWILELLTRCTQDLEEKAAREFWSGVTGREASLALFLLAQHIWEDNLTDVPQIALCRAEHETEVDDLSWDEFTVKSSLAQVGPSTFVYDLLKPRDDLRQIKGALPTLGQLKQIENEMTTAEEAAFNSLFRMTLKGPGDKVLTLAQVQKLDLVDRRRLKNILNGEDHVLVDTRFKRPCSECHRKAYGVLNLRGFF